MHRDARLLVHAADEVAGVPADLDVDVGIEADGEVVQAVGVQELDPANAIGRCLVVQPCIHVPHADGAHVERG